MRMALGDEPGLFRQVPKRPKGMHHRTYERRISELQRIEDKVRVSIPRRLGDLTVRRRTASLSGITIFRCITSLPRGSPVVPRVET